MVDSVELTFLDPVLDGVTIAVADDADGSRSRVSGRGCSVRDGRSVRVTFDPLTTAGGYVVEYAFTAAGR